MRYRWFALPLGVLGLSTSLATGVGHAAPAPVALGGGSGLIVGKLARNLGPITNTGEFVCSLATIGHDRAGRLVGLTAGHCGPPGTAVIAENAVSAGVVGTIESSTGKSRGDQQGLDYAIIEFDPAKVTPMRTVGGTTISSIGATPARGATVCHSGRTSGSNCGVVLGSFRTVLDGLTAPLPGGDGVWSGLSPDIGNRILDKATSAPGDSGGPVTDGDRLVGIQEGVITPPFIPAEVPLHIAAVFVPIDRVMRGIDATGGIGAGFRPI
ncbi:S1 family peptidase [Nocardia alni]|uniref:S1 family peptidase n=1 Tax=Nocardia alni TaxID=2815723 RepID=UPI001C21D955|nr:S1 family peptidase [Nocardia alni]